MYIRFMKLLQKYLSLVLLFVLGVPAWADAPGKNGSRTISSGTVIINQYDVLNGAAVAGATTITVNNISNLVSPESTGGGPLGTGDVVMIYQARGATINTTNTPTYGDITYLNAGNYELRTVRSVAGNVITLDASSNGTACVAGLKNSYSSGAQVIRVPQYSNLTVSASASVSATTWTGSVGGVVAALVQGTLTVDGSISVNGQGFRGGIRDGTDRPSGGGETVTFVSDASPAGGQKGEGIASGGGGDFGGVALTYSNPGGNFDIGAPANGGGGGGSHNGGGGGGANAASSLTPYCTAGTSTYTTAATTAFVWCGQGVMPAGVTGATAWQFDPGRKANGGVNTAQVGGGRGGYTYSANNLDATTAAGAPALTGWGGDNRRALGGWGGRPLQQTPSTRLFFGGGGGAGANNNNKGGAGGAGGGIILIEAGSLAGSGSLTANGADGALATDAGNFGNDAPGGGGAGGTIVVRAGSGSLGATANGGVGGNQNLTTSNEAEGPGGGGGGGLIAVSNTGGTANGGAGGTTNSPSLTEFPRNGATDGSSGLTGQPPPPIRSAAASCTNLSVSKDNGVTSLVAGGTTTYALTVVNSGPSLADGTVVRDPAVTGLNCTSVTCSAVGGAVCPTAGSTTIAYLQSAGGITLPTLPANSTATFALNCTVTATGQ